MELNSKISELLVEASLLSSEDRDALIHELISKKIQAERLPDEVEVRPDGTRLETYWVRPEERRTIRERRYDVFMGL